MSDIDFNKVLADAGVPVTEAAATARLRKIAQEENAPFNNLSPLSPFGRLISRLFVAPLLWLTGVLSAEILPALFLKTATGKWVDMFAWQLGLTRKPATKALGRITLTRYESSNTLTVPASTVIQSAAIAGRVYRLLVIEQSSFAIGQTTLQVVCEASEVGSAFNLAAGFYALVITSLSGIASAVNAEGWLVTPGADEESDDELKARCRNQFAAVNSWTIDAVYKALVSEAAGIGIDDLYIAHDAPRGPGTANIYVLSDEVSNNSTFYADITQRLKDNTHGLGDDVLVLPIPTHPIQLQCRVRLSTWLSSSELNDNINNIKNFILVALRTLPASIGYQPTRVTPYRLFSWSRLITELHETFPALVSIEFVGVEDLTPQLWVTQLSQLEVEVLT